MPFYSKVAGKIILPIGDRFIGSSIAHHLKSFERSQWNTKEEFRKMQKVRLKSLIGYAYANVPYYHRSMKKMGIRPDNIRTLSDLQRMPIISKGIVLNNFDEFVSNHYADGKGIRLKSGGTTGKVFHSIKSMDSKSVGWATAFRAWGWAGMKYGDKHVTLAGSSLIPGRNTSLFKRGRNIIERNLPLSATHMSPAMMDKYAKDIERFRPKFIRGYPSSIFTFAKHLSEHSNYSIRPEAIFVTAEMLFQHQRKFIEEMFGCDVFDHYSNPESGADGYECGEHTGLHMSSESAIMEFLDRDASESVDDGERGEIVSTDLWNYDMPFIRYRTEDIGVPAEDSCNCGRKLPLIESLVGRATDILEFHNGVRLGGPAITLIFKEFNVCEYQLIQKNRDHLQINIIKDDNFSKEESKLLLDTMKFHCGNDVTIEISFVDEIVKSQSGKNRFIISELD